VLGCSSDPAPRARSVSPTLVNNAPVPLANTVGAQTQLRGTTPMIVSGLGFVVGLDGTGGQPLPEEVAGTIEREMSLRSVGRSDAYKGTALEGRAPSDILRDPNTAVVIVMGAVPPGSTKGAVFDVYVQALNADSLEGGQLFTTELRLGPPATYLAKTRQLIGAARGPIFINPYPNARGSAGVRTNVGRVLNGGTVTSEGLAMEIVLPDGSHARARQIEDAINQRFEADAYTTRGVVARGRSGTSIALTMPAGYRDKPSEFVSLVRTLQLDLSAPQLYAQRYISAVEEDASLANDMAYALQALGPGALVPLRGVYNSPNETLRRMALQAGAGLNDQQAAPHLLGLARTGSPELQPDAISLVSRIDGSPIIDVELRKLLDSPLLPVRVAAYEALTDRAVRVRRQRIAREARASRDLVRTPLTEKQIDLLAKAEIVGDPVRGIERTLVAGKFYLDTVSTMTSRDGLVYVTQQGTPRIALFGQDFTLRTPMLLSLWDGELILVSDEASPTLRVGLRTRTGTRRVGECEPNLHELVKLLAREPSPDDPRIGMGLSYAQVVGVLSEVVRRGEFPGAFATERDRLLAELLADSEAEEIEMRPERAGEEPDVIVFEGLTPTREAPGESGAPIQTLPPPVSPEEAEAARKLLRQQSRRR